ncbi:MAG: regulatory protein, FmdB family [Lysobacterales bacterium]|jgi:putative FmdB family regulatory protein|nr:MAG: regulatory protein, FmdB family [Xanthomonadales bacterium]
MLIHGTMPIYEYECIRCEHRFEELVRLSDPEPDACPSCGQTTVRRRVSAPSFRLAGSGWYETDFKSDRETKRNLAGERETAKREGESCGTCGKPPGESCRAGAAA